MKIAKRFFNIPLTRDQIHFILHAFDILQSDYPEDKGFMKIYRETKRKAEAIERKMVKIIITEENKAILRQHEND